mgnify:CR=1 FL=1
MNYAAFDLGTTTGWAACFDGMVRSGTWSFQPQRFEGGGMRFLRFRRNISELLLGCVQPEMVVFFEEVRRHAGTTAAHVYGGFMAELTAFCDGHSIPYSGIPVGTIKKHATGKGNANKQAMIDAAKERWPDVVLEDDNHADALWILDCGMTLLKEI